MVQIVTQISYMYRIADAAKMMRWNSNIKNRPFAHTEDQISKPIRQEETKPTQT